MLSSAVLTSLDKPLRKSGLVGFGPKESTPPAAQVSDKTKQQKVHVTEGAGYLLLVLCVLSAPWLWWWRLY